MRERRKISENEDDNFNVFDTRQIADAMNLPYLFNSEINLLSFAFAGLICISRPVPLTPTGPEQSAFFFAHAAMSRAGFGIAG